jgi:hypothetical protein
MSNQRAKSAREPQPELCNPSQPSAACQLYLQENLEGIKDAIRDSSKEISDRLLSLEIAVNNDSLEILAVKKDLTGNGKPGFRQVRDEFAAHKAHHAKIEERTWQVGMGIAGKVALILFNVFLAYVLFAGALAPAKTHSTPAKPVIEHVIH